MLRFFRHIRKTLMEQNKTRTYLLYAIGEIFLVVVGILIALQVNNWNEQRKEQAQKAEYLDRLEENLVKDLKDIEIRVNFYSQVKDRGDRIIRSQEEKKSSEIDSWDLLAAYFQASQIWPMVLNDVTYSELKSAGELELIRNVDLRARLNAYYADLYKQYEATIGINPDFREKIRSQIPFKLQDLLWEQCIEIGYIVDSYSSQSDQTELNQTLNDCDKPESVNDYDVDQALSTISTEENLQDLRFWMTNVYVGLSVFDIISNEAEAMIFMINKLQGE